ncbi:MAG: division/cell wall cluster transcriptional repressor MraZ [Gemmatimonadetes bacterium]|jgi:MraZ protein|nr:division/cell wall cluster transcriptional repressor MraZ [Gemmatimonadota bacterium]
MGSIMQFLGEYDVPLDEKGRIFVPAEFRKKLPAEAGDTFVIVRGYDRCLSAYPQHIWDGVAKKLMKLSQTERRHRVFLRAMLSQAAEVKMDRQGRAALPRKLLERAGIDGQIVVIGALDKLEFWEPKSWTAFLKEADQGMEEAAEHLQL